MITWVVFLRMFWNFISSLPVKRGGSLSFLVGTISNVLVMEIGLTDVGSGGYILVSRAHSNTSCICKPWSGGRFTRNLDKKVERERERFLSKFCFLIASFRNLFLIPNTKLYEMLLWKVLYKECSFLPDPLTNMAATGHSCFWLVDF
jgi:hypothetical protein